MFVALAIHNLMYVFNTQERLAEARIGSTDVRIFDRTPFFTFIAAALVVFYLSYLVDYTVDRDWIAKQLYFHLFTVCLAGVALLSHPKVIFHKYPKAILIWIGLYLGLLLMNFLLSSQAEAALVQIIKGLETAALLFSFVVLFLLASDAKVLTKILVIVVLFSVCLNVYDFVIPTFSGVTGRAAGFYGNANIAGQVLAISMVLSCMAVPKPLRLAYCLVVGVGILVTFSRSSWLLWAIGFSGLAGTGQLFLRSRMASFLVLGAVSLLVIYALLSGAMFNLFQEVGIDRYLTSGTVSRLGGSGAAFQDASAIGRIDQVWYSLSEFQKHPWFGAGLGATSEWISRNRPHNLYLMFAVEAGIFGLLVLFALIGILWAQVNSIGRIVVILIAVSFLFTHNDLENVHMMCLIAIMIVAYPRQNWRPDKSVQYAINKFA